MDAATHVTLNMRERGRLKAIRAIVDVASSMVARQNWLRGKRGRSGNRYLDERPPHYALAIFGKRKKPSRNATQLRMRLYGDARRGVG
ncbi:hypothetical protein OH764_33030 (plasmid) [Burkholderia sp. M6-3]